MLKAKVVTVNPKELIVNVDNAGGDATLKFEQTLNAKVIEVGAPIEFKGVVDSFTKAPYMLTITIDEPKNGHQRSAGDSVCRCGDQTSPSWQKEEQEIVFLPCAAGLPA